MTRPTTFNFNILVTGAPFDSLAAHSALLFSRAAVAAGNTIEQVFFYQQGAHIASGDIKLLDDDFDARSAWVEFAEQNSIRLCACVSASENRGVATTNGASLDHAFEVVGLGQLYEASLTANRTVTFK